MAEMADSTRDEGSPIEARVIALIAAHAGVARARIGAGTRLLHDLGMDGDDADEFIVRFAETFAVDLAGYDHGAFFGPEAAFEPFSYLYRLLFARHRLATRPLTVRHLAAVAAAGRWTAPGW